MPRITTGALGRVVAVVATATLLGSAVTSADAAAPSTRQARSATPTKFAFHGWAYGTSARGGSVPAGSGGTAYEVIGCTNLAGAVRTNRVADATIPSLGSASGVDTRVWTTQASGTTTTWARNSISQVTLSDSSLGSLVLSAVSTTARAYHDRQGYHATANTDVARVQFKPAAGPAQDFAVPSPGHPVTIPGFAKIIVAGKYTPTTAGGAKAFANGVKVEMTASGSTVRIARAVAQITGGVVSGLFSGQSYGIDGKAGGDVVRLGKNPLMKMGCVGTHGKTRTRSLASLDLGGGVVAQGMRDSEAADQTRDRAWGWERNEVASLSLGGGQLVVRNVVARARAVRKGPGLATLKRSARSRIGALVVNGTAQEPPTQEMTIPGVAKLEPRVVTRLRNGVKVIGLRITLLDGSGAVINLGNAQVQVRRAAR